VHEGTHAGDRHPDASTSITFDREEWKWR
jgi:hypothetical protein